MTSRAFERGNINMPRLIGYAFARHNLCKPEKHPDLDPLGFKVIWNCAPPGMTRVFPKLRSCSLSGIQIVLLLGRTQVVLLNLV